MRFYRRLPTIQAMTFDLDDTLYDNYPVIMRVEREVAAWLKAQYPQCQQLSMGQWHQIKQQLIIDDPALVNDVTLWRWKQIVSGLSLSGYTQAQAKDAADKAMEQVQYWRNLVEVPQQAHDVLSQLAQAMPLIGITNGNVDPDKIGLSRYFCHVYRAGRDGRLKPSPDMFQLAQRKLNIHSRHILHVGDHLRSDVLGAKQSGYSACWLPYADQRLQRATTLPDVEISDLSQLLNFIR